VVGKIRQNIVLRYGGEILQTDRRQQVRQTAKKNSIRCAVDRRRSEILKFSQTLAQAG